MAELHEQIKNAIESKLEQEQEALQNLKYLNIFQVI